MNSIPLMITFIILGISILLFISNRVRTDLVAMLALLALVLTGIIDVTEAFAGFANTIVIMIVGLFIVGAGIYRTGLARMAGTLLLKWANNNEKRLFVLLMLITAVIGAFMSNTGTVALMMPIVVSLALSMKKAPSKYLLPLSYIASMSGMLTLIASPTNLIVSELLVDYGYDSLGFFEITPIGIIAVIVVILYLYLVRNTLLPDTKTRNGNGTEMLLSPARLSNDYDLGDELYRLEVTADSPLVDKRLFDLQIPPKYGIFILQVSRKALEGMYPIATTTEEMAGPRTVIATKDILYVQGSYDGIKRFMEDYSLLLRVRNDDAEHLISKKMGIAEVLLTPHSGLINETIQSYNFREKYNLNILGLSQQRKAVTGNKSKRKLRFGDSFLVQGTWEDIELLSKETNDVVVIGQPEEHASMASASGKAPIAGLIMLAMVLLMIFEVFPVVITVLIGAILMVITGCVRNMDDAYSQVNWETIVLIAAMLPMATALEKTGGMDVMSNGIVDLLGGYGPLAVLAGIYIITMLFGQFISNTATAVLFGPIALNTALALEANPYTFLIVIAVASGMSFMTPVASPTNALVMSAGGYKFFDFMKIGVPLQVIMFLVMMVAIPFFFPL